MKRIFIPFLLSWLAFVPQTFSQCPSPGTQYENLCTGPLGKIILTTFDVSGYNPDSLTYTWSNGAVTKHPNTSTDNQLFVTGGLGGLTNGNYFVTISDDDGCTWTAGPIEITCGPSSCDHLTALSWECTYYPGQQIDVKFTHAVWDVSVLPGTPYVYEWSNGETTYGEFLPGGIYGSQLLVEDYQSPLTVTITDDTGCSWTEDAVSDCNNHPPAGMTYVCVDELATITAIIWSESYVDSSLTFTWSTGEITPVILINNLPASVLPNVQNGTYTVEIETGGGNSWEEEITVDCDGLPFNECGHLIGTSYECVTYVDLGVEVNVTLVFWDVDEEPSVPYVFEWSTGEITYSDFDDDFLKTEFTVFNLSEPLFVTITDDEGCTWTEFIQVNCLYPGDTDLNGAVNHYDLLNIGLGYHANGAARSAASFDWTPQEATSWNSQTPQSNVNYVFSDVDGNGSVETVDETGIQVNWGQTISPDHVFENDRELPLVPHEPIPFYVEASELTEGEAYTLPVMLGNSLVNVEGAYGVAFTIEYDPEIFDSENVVVNFTNSWLGNIGEDLLAVYRNFPTEGIIEIALTRNDGQPISGEGILCELEFIVIEDVIFMSNGSEDMESEIIVSEAMLITEQEEKFGLAPMSTIIEINPEISSFEDLNFEDEIEIMPNPSSSFTMISSPYDMNRIEIFAPTGESLYQIETKNKWVALPVNGFQNGLYLLKIQTESGTATKKLLIVK